MTKRRLLASPVAFVLLLLSIPMVVSATPSPISNPDLAASCGTDVSIVLDRSGSIGANNTKVQQAAQTFVDALVGTGSKVQLVSFSERATAEPGAGAALGDLAFVDPATLDVPTFTSSGTTNWDDALEMVRRSPAGHAPLTVLITDGDPTRRNATQPDGHGGSLLGTGTTSQTDLDAAVTEANLIKGLSEHLFVVGVGSAVSNASSEARIQAISGPDELTFTGDVANIDFGAADYTLVQDFTVLQTTVARFVRELCGPSLNVVKQLQLANGTTVPATDADAFTFDVSLAPTPSVWLAPAQAPGAAASLTTSDGVANFAWDPNTPTSATTITLGEQAKAGWVYNGQRCWLNNLDGTPALLVVDDVGANVIGASKPATGHVLPAVGAYQAMNCEVFNRQVHAASVSVDKVTVPGGRTESFSFTLRTGGNTVHSIPSMTDATPATAFPAVAPGTYDVVEADDAHFTKTAATCDNLSTQGVEQTSAAGLVVGEGSTWQCTFTNTLHGGSIRVVKDLQAAPSGTFGFTSSIPGHADFQLEPTAGNDASMTFPVAAGTYAVAEGPHGPYALSATCDHGSTPNNIVVSPDVQTTCTFTNTAPPPSITVNKSVFVPLISEPGADVTYGVAITNTSVEPLVLTKLTDTFGGDTIDIFDLPGSDTTCLPLEGAPIAPGATAECAFVVHVSGNAGQTVVDTVEAEATDSDGNVAPGSDTASVDITDVTPTLTMNKSTSTPTVAEPGGVAVYDVSITNTSHEIVTLLSLTDEIAGGGLLPLTAVAGLITQTTCALVPILPQATYSCSFTAPVAGNAGTVVPDVARASAIDDDGTSVQASDDAAVTLTDVLPAITVTKTASPTSLPEPGGDVTYTVGIHNDRAEAVTIDAISDAVGGGAPFAAGGSCAALVGTTLGGGGQTSCTFTIPVTGDASDGPVADTVTVSASDDEDHSTTGSASASVTLTDVLPTIDVTKSAAPTSVAEPGAVVTFTVGVTNGSVEPVTIDAIVDSVDGGASIDVTTLPGTCDDLVGTSLAPTASTSCTFELFVGGNGGADVDDVVTVSVGDDDGNQGSDTADASVPVSDVVPTISVTKVAGVASVPEPGAQVTYTVTVTNESVESVTLTSLTDVIGDAAAFDITDVAGTTCVLPQVLGIDDFYACTFAAPANGNASDVVSDTVTAGAHDDDDNDTTAMAEESVTVTDVGPQVTVTKTTSTPSLTAPGGPATFEVFVTNESPEAVILTEITDTIDDVDTDVTTVAGAVTATTCVVPTVLGAAGEDDDSYTCTFTLALTGTEAATITDVVTVVAHDDEDNEIAADDDASTTLVPSADLVLDKEATVVPTVGQTGTYTLVVTNDGPSTATDVVVIDQLPALLLATSATGDGWTCEIADDAASVTCTRAELASGASASIVIEVSVGDPGVGVAVTNTATVSSPTPDPDLTNNTDTVTVVPPRLLDASSPTPTPAALPKTGAGLRSWVVVADVLLILGLFVRHADTAWRRRLLGS